MTTDGRRFRRVEALRFDVKNAAMLYRRGLTCQQIADRYGLTRSYVSTRLRQAGTPMRPAQRPREQHHLDRGALLRLRQAGATWAELATIFRVTRYAVQRCYAETTATPPRQGDSTGSVPAADPPVGDL